MHRRVEEWNSRVEPLLAEQNTHPDFDISVYRDRLLQSFSSRERVPMLKQATKASASLRPEL